MAQTTTMALTEFLEARFADDEAAALAAISATGDAAWGTRSYRVVASGEFEVADASVPAAAHIARHNPARVLREVEAKRFVLALADAIEQEVKNLGGTPAAPLANGRASAVETVLRRLATVYSDHPDYREEWRL